VASEPDRPAELIARLGLAAHPERGFYVETYRAPLTVAGGIPHGGPRAASTAIYFLVTRAQPTTFLHRLKSDELFHLYEGGPLEVLLLRDDGAAEVRRLGLDIAAGERPQLVIPAGTWFAVELAAGAGGLVLRRHRGRAGLVQPGRLHGGAGVRLRRLRAGRRARAGGAPPGARGAHRPHDPPGVGMTQWCTTQRAVE